MICNFCGIETDIWEEYETSTCGTQLLRTIPTICKFCGSFLGSEEDYLFYCFYYYPIEFEESFNFL